MRKVWARIKEKVRRRGWLAIELVLAFVLAGWSADHGVSDYQFWLGLAGFAVMANLIWGDGRTEGFKEGQQSRERLFARAGVTTVRDKDGRITGVGYPVPRQERLFAITKFSLEQVEEVNKHEED